jgi:hypothetical protein
MPTLGGAAAQPLRFLDFLIADPVRSVMLYRGGVPVRIPAPERFAVHKLIVATRRGTEDETQSGFASKREKDIRQAGILVEALSMKRRQVDLTEAWAEAWDRGPAWREAMAGGRAMMVPGQRVALDDAVVQGCRELGRGNLPDQRFTLLAVPVSLPLSAVEGRDHAGQSETQGQASPHAL